MTEPELIWRLARMVPTGSVLDMPTWLAVVDYMGSDALAAPDWETAWEAMGEHWRRQRAEFRDPQLFPPEWDH